FQFGFLSAGANGTGDPSTPKSTPAGLKPGATKPGRRRFGAERPEWFFAFHESQITSYESRFSGNSLLAHQVEVGVAAYAGVNNVGEVAGRVICGAFGNQRKCKWKSESDLGLADEFSVLPALAVNGDVVLGGNGVGEGPAVGSEANAEGDYAGQNRNALLLGEREFVKSIPVAGPDHRNQLVPSRRHV